MPETSSAAADARKTPRSNVFLAAVLHLSGAAFPVRIRNLSRSGALVDGNAIPDEGDVVRLERGPHSVVARIAWRNPDACGLRFASAVPVHEWMAYGSGHQGQERVDEMIASVRSGAPAVEPVEPATWATAIERTQTAEQLQIAADRLAVIADSFAAIPAVVDHASDALQELDIARQKLVDLSTILRRSGC